MMAKPSSLPRCFECGAPTCWRVRGRDGQGFVSCTRYPKCRATLSIEQLGKMIEKLARAKRLAADRAANARTRLESPATSVKLR